MGSILHKSPCLLSTMRCPLAYKQWWFKRMGSENFGNYQSAHYRLQPKYRNIKKNSTSFSYVCRSVQSGAEHLWLVDNNIHWHLIKLLHLCGSFSIPKVLGAYPLYQLYPFDQQEYRILLYVLMLSVLIRYF